MILAMTEQEAVGQDRPEEDKEIGLSRDGGQCERQEGHAPVGERLKGSEPMVLCEVEKADTWDS